MKGWLISKEAMCPFYHGERDNRIRCEGVDGGSIRLAFETAEKRKEYGWKFCKCWDYEKCVLCQALEKKYEG